MKGGPVSLSLQQPEGERSESIECHVSARVVVLLCVHEIKPDACMRQDV